MKINPGIFLVIAGILVLTSCLGAREQGKDTPLRTVQTDNYTAVINADGTLTFADKDGNAILDSSPRFYFDYGDRSVGDVSLTNPSFEADSNLDGIPDGWTVDKAYIRQSDKHASDGNKSLKFDMAAADAAPRRSYSPVIEIAKDSSYSIKLDVYVESSASGTVNIITYGYPSADGTGRYNSSLAARVSTVNTGAWNTVSMDWNPPYDARSFKLLLSSDNNTVATMYFDNLRVSQTTIICQSNGDNIVTNVVTFGNDVTITAADDTNSSITVAQFADYLRLQQNVRISNISGGDYRVTNNNPGPIKGLTLLAEGDVISVSLDGKELSLSGGSYKGNKVILPALSPGRTALLSISYRTLP